MSKFLFLLGCFIIFTYCTKQKDCFEISKKVKVNNRFFFYWGSLDIGNIDELNPPAKTGEVSKYEYDSYIEGDTYCPNK
mgnify:FL=1|tara:strand:+ start:188 stop:424 length:237 start_codon:yes stop_codon:yes gene_type:complete